MCQYVFMSETTTTKEDMMSNCYCDVDATCEACAVEEEAYWAAYFGNTANGFRYTPEALADAYDGSYKAVYA